MDFGLLDKEGNLLGNPVHYRDARVNGMLDKSFEKIDKDTFYGITGNQFMEINTVFQLLHVALNKKELLEQADSLLMMPDLFDYYLFRREMLRIFHCIHNADAGCCKEELVG